MEPTIKTITVNGYECELQYFDDLLTISCDKLDLFYSEEIEDLADKSIKKAEKRLLKWLKKRIR